MVFRGSMKVIEEEAIECLQALLHNKNCEMLTMGECVKLMYENVASVDVSILIAPL